MTCPPREPSQAHATLLLWLRHANGAYRQFYANRDHSLALSAYDLAVAKLMVDPERVLDPPESLIPTRIEINAAAKEIARALDLTPATGTVLVRELEQMEKPMRP